MKKGRETQNIAELQDELIKAQKLEARIKAEDNSFSRVIYSYAAKTSIYKDPKRLDALIDELEKELKTLMKEANGIGYLRGKKKMSDFLDASERYERTARQKAVIEKLSAKQAAARLNVSYAELEKQTGILKADIKIFQMNAKLAGISDKEVLKQLVTAAEDKAGIVAGFEKRVKSLADAAVRREAAQSEIDAYREDFKDDTDYQWITISVNPCPDCKARAGTVLPYTEWERIGTPGAGQTICGPFCLCRLIPAKVSEEMFPTVKEFKWSRESTVLTPMSTMKKLEKAQD